MKAKLAMFAILALAGGSIYGQTHTPKKAHAATPGDVWGGWSASSSGWVSSSTGDTFPATNTRTVIHDCLHKETDADVNFCAQRGPVPKGCIILRRGKGYECQEPLPPPALPTDGVEPQYRVIPVTQKVPYCPPPYQLKHFDPGSPAATGTFAWESVLYGPSWTDKTSPSADITFPDYRCFPISTYTINPEFDMPQGPTLDAFIYDPNYLMNHDKQGHPFITDGDMDVDDDEPQPMPVTICEGDCLEPATTFSGCDKNQPADDEDCKVGKVRIQGKLELENVQIHPDIKYCDQLTGNTHNQACVIRPNQGFIVCTQFVKDLKPNDTIDGLDGILFACYNTVIHHPLK